MIELTQQPVDYGYNTHDDNCVTIDVRGKRAFDEFHEGRQMMVVEININWNFLGEEERANVTYGTSPARLAPAEESDDGALRDYPLSTIVLPLTSSVLAPGLSMPVSTP